MVRQNLRNANVPKNQRCHHAFHAVSKFPPLWCHCDSVTTNCHTKNTMTNCIENTALLYGVSLTRTEFITHNNPRMRLITVSVNVLVSIFLHCLLNSTALTNSKSDLSSMSHVVDFFRCSTSPAHARFGVCAFSLVLRHQEVSYKF